MAPDLKKVFYRRTEQHGTLYQHRIVHVHETMITDILALANPAFRYRGGGGKPTSLTEAAVAGDCASYVLLNDTIVEQIYMSMQPGLVRSSTSNAPQPSASTLHLLALLCASAATAASS